MKKNKIIFLLAGLVGLFFASCESDEEKYSGTPVGNQEIITLQGRISTTTTDALFNQKVPFTVELPQQFKDTVTVEVTTLGLSGTRTRVSVDLMPNQTVISDVIPAVGGSIFNNTFELFISGISLKHTEPGRHYLIESNRITINTGNSTVPSDDSSKLQVSVFWFNPNQNDFRVWVDRPNVVNYTSAPGATNNGNVITVNDTSGLRVGMVVTVSSGTGAFRANTMVTEITSATTFTTNLAPRNTATVMENLGNNAVVTGGGENFVLNGASSGTGADATTITLSSGTTEGLVVGMPVAVIGGTGRFTTTTGPAAASATILEIKSPTQFRVSGVAAALVNATVAAIFPDVYPSDSSHGFANVTVAVSPGTSSQAGEYTLKILPTKLLTSGADVAYRVVWKFPNGTVGYYNGVFEGATLSSLSETVLKVTKTGSGPGATYDIVSVFP